MNTPELQRGEIPIELDRTRILFFDMKATWLIQQRYGGAYLRALYKQAEHGTGVELNDPDALVFFLWAGLQSDAVRSGETLTHEQAERLVGMWNYRLVFQAVVLAITGAVYAPPLDQGKASADGAPAKPAAGSMAAGKGPGPTKVSTSSRRSAGPSASRAGRRHASGR